MDRLYFEWLLEIIEYNPDGPETHNYLLWHLYGTPFYYLKDTDENRVFDGLKLREEYDEYFAVSSKEYPCSVLEVLIALAKRCEEDIMEDPDSGDKTPQWFWIMIQNLGLLSMDDAHYDGRYVQKVLTKFMNREYGPDGRGSIFYSNNTDRDFRTADLWYQMCWYLVEHVYA